MKAEWYIDAWSVIDGYAFASARPPDSLDALATFYVSPPYFEPEPVASLATALAATRGHFQEGYRLGGDEVAFDSPEQVVEAVRQAYRAGGIDMNGGPLPSAPRPRPRRPDEIHPESLVDDRIRGIWNDLRPWLRRQHSDAWPRRHFESLLTQLIEAMFPTLVPKFVGYAALEMIEAVTREGVNRSQAAQGLAAWLDRARAIGIDVQLGSGVTAAVRGMNSGFGWDTSALPPMSPMLVESLFPIMYRTSGAMLSEFQIPFIVPIPFPFQFAGPPPHDFPPVPTLGHLLAVVSADPWYLSQVDSVVAFVPVVVGALIQLPARSLPQQGFPPVDGSRELREVSGAAARWLSRAFPSDHLRGHPVEKTIHDLVVRLLTRTNDARDDGSSAASL
jgi:hypothetical protein